MGVKLSKYKVRINNQIISNNEQDDLNEISQQKGDHETQWSEHGEADLHRHFIGCKKNPGHVKFIPFPKFTMEHLPRGYRKDHELYDLILCVGQLTVRVDVKMISPDRPEFWPDTDVSYPFHDLRGRTNLRFGSGRVWRVNRFSDGLEDSGAKHRSDLTACPCRRCQISDTPSRVWWETMAYTAAHVVVDALEASHTSLKLFYDDGSKPVESAVTMDTVVIDAVSLQRDWCRLVSVTCDSDLGHRLTRTVEHFLDSWNKVHDRYRDVRDVDRLTFIISHPHGCSKQVSVGRWERKYQAEDKKFLNQFLYTTPTCPGSSGAPVYCVGYTGWFWCQQMLSGALPSGLNYSGYGCVM